MVKMFAFLPKRADVPEEEFHAHWRNPHGELAKRITTLRRYVQSHRIAAADSGLPQSIYEGIPEVWFDNVETGLGMGTDPNYTEGAALDEPNFIDVANLAFLFALERVNIEGPVLLRDTPGVKLLHLINRDRATRPEEFRERYEAIAREQAPVIGARSDVLCVAHPDAYREEEPIFDAVHELSFDDLGDFQRSRELAGTGWEQLTRSDLLDGPGFGFVAEEYRVIWPEQ